MNQTNTLSLRLPSGEIRTANVKSVAIDGCIGAGKSTLVGLADTLPLFTEDESMEHVDNESETLDGGDSETLDDGGNSIIKELNNSIEIKDFVSPSTEIVGVFEPSDEWKRSGMLKLFYGDIPRNSFLFQMNAFDSRLKRFEKRIEDFKNLVESGKIECPENVIFFMERSIFTDPIFVEVLFESGGITQLERNVYYSFHTRWVHLLPFIPTHFLFLNYTIEKLMTQVRERGRDEEKDLTPDYQSQLSEMTWMFYEWISGSENSPREYKNFPIWKEPLEKSSVKIVNNDYDLFEHESRNELLRLIGDWLS